MRRRIALGTVAVIAMFASVLLAQNPSANDAHTQEIARLHAEIQRLSHEKSRLRKRLKEASNTIDQLRIENAELKKLCDETGARGAQAAASQQIAGFFAWVCDRVDEGGVSAADRLVLINVLATMMHEWTSGNAERLKVVGEAEAVLLARARTLAHEQPKTTSLYAVSHDAGAIREILENVDRTNRAKAKASMLGMKVQWRGKVTEATSRSRLYQLVLDCDDVVVYVDIGEKRHGELNGVRAGIEVTLTGTIADIGEEFTGAHSVLITHARVEACDPRIRAKQNLGKKKT